MNKGVICKYRNEGGVSSEHSSSVFVKALIKSGAAPGEEAKGEAKPKERQNLAMELPWGMLLPLLLVLSVSSSSSSSAAATLAVSAPPPVPVPPPRHAQDAEGNTADCCACLSLISPSPRCFFFLSVPIFHPLSHAWCSGSFRLDSF
jgi:hypothetical protein